MSEWYCKTCGDGPHTVTNACPACGVKHSRKPSGRTAAHADSRVHCHGHTNMSNDDETLWYCSVCRKGPYGAPTVECPEVNCPGKQPGKTAMQPSEVTLDMARTAQANYVSLSPYSSSGLDTILRHHWRTPLRVRGRFAASRMAQSNTSDESSLHL